MPDTVTVDGTGLLVLISLAMVLLIIVVMQFLLLAKKETLIRNMHKNLERQDLYILKLKQMLAQNAPVYFGFPPPGTPDQGAPQQRVSEPKEPDLDVPPPGKEPPA